MNNSVQFVQCPRKKGDKGEGKTRKKWMAVLTFDYRQTD